MFKNILVAIMLTLLFVFAINAKADARPFATFIEKPSGCPPTRFCGCALRKFLGLSDKRLDLAWNWARLFPRTIAAPGAVAVRHHHVMLLVAHSGGSVFVVRDYNSGGHQSRIHQRDVSGYTFVSVGSSYGWRASIQDEVQGRYGKSHTRRIRQVNSTRARRWHEAINMGEVGNSW